MTTMTAAPRSYARDPSGVALRGALLRPTEQVRLLDPRVAALAVCASGTLVGGVVRLFVG